MKHCPKCNRSYTTDNQKFCTHDGGLLVAVDIGLETVRIETSQFDADAPTKTISGGLNSEVTGEFDPFKTMMAPPEATTSERLRNTGDLSHPSATLYPPSGQAPAPTEGSGQISQPPPPTPSQPTMRLTGSGSIPVSAPLPSPSVPLPAQPTAAPPVKKSRMPLVLGILAVLLVLGAGVVGAAYFFVVAPMLSARRVEVAEPTPAPNKEPTPNIQATPDTVPEPPAYSPPADAVEFVNSKTNLDGKLAEHYVDFSFYYPDRWAMDPTAGVRGASNFAKVERRLPPDFTQENFAVGWYSSAGSAEADRSVFPTLAEKLSKQFEKSFPEYAKVSEGETRAGVYDGYEFRFEAMSRNTPKGDLKLWGRLIFIPPVDGGKNGVTLLMLATSLAPELKTVNDVGRKGELPMMLESFRFGKK